jgi:hypothetical protein
MTDAETSGRVWRLARTEAHAAIGFARQIENASLHSQALAHVARFSPSGQRALLEEARTAIGWSDHLTFWQHGYAGVMITDTAPFRYPHYHSATDTSDQIVCDRLARVVVGLGRVVDELAR